MLQQNSTDTLHLKNSGQFLIEISLGPGPNLMKVNRDNCIGFHQFDINQTNKTYKGEDFVRTELQNCTSSSSGVNCFRETPYYC